MSEDAKTSALPAVRNTSSDSEKTIDNLCRRVKEQTSLERLTRVGLYAIIADILLLANVALENETYKAAIDERFRLIAPNSKLNQTLDYKISVVVFNAECREERKKSGKVGRVLPILRRETNGDGGEVIRYLLNNSGIEGVLKLHSSSNCADLPAKGSSSAADLFETDESDKDENESWYKEDEIEENISSGESTFKAERLSDIRAQDRIWLLSQLAGLVWPHQVLLVELEKDDLDHVLGSTCECCSVELEADFPDSDGFISVKLVRFPIDEGV